MVITVSVIYSPQKALPCFRQTVRLPAGSTVSDALTATHLYEKFPEAQVLSIGIHAKLVSLTQPLEPNDRIEIYRSLVIDPKSARRKRAKS